MKHAQRLDDARLAEVLNERGMADLDVIRDLLQVAQDGGMQFAEALVTTSLVNDWDLSRVTAEIFQLPFLPVTMVKPDEKLWAEIGCAFMKQYGIVPLSRFGQVLTIAMPGLVTAEILAMLSAETDMTVLPVVGTVETNRRWILENKGASGTSKRRSTGDWGALFDEGDAAVQLSLDDEEEIDAEALEAELKNVDAALEEIEGDIEELEFTGDTGGEGAADPPSLARPGSDAKPSEPAEGVGSTGGGLELPPAPEFG